MMATTGVSGGKLFGLNRKHIRTVPEARYAALYSLIVVGMIFLSLYAFENKQVQVSTAMLGAVVGSIPDRYRGYLLASRWRRHGVLSKLSSPMACLT